MASSSGTGSSSGVDPGLVVALPAPPQEGDGLQPQLFLKILRRRRRIFLGTVLAVTLVAGLHTLYRRIHSPVFQGGFTLLILDPVNNQGSGSQNQDGTIASVARNVNQVDVPTLIRVLESPSVLEPVYVELRKQFPDLPPPAINVRLLSADPTQRSPILASGVLQVQASGSNPEQLSRALDLTQQAYLNWALKQRREKLNEAVAFLDKQAPNLEARNLAIQDQIQRFRLSNNVLQPQEEATAIRSQVETLRSTLLSQQVERQRLLKVRSEVASGRLTARGFSASAGDSGSSGSATSSSNVTLDVPNRPLLDEYQLLEKQIAEAEAIYQPGTPFLVNLIASRDKLRPQLQAKEIEAVDASLGQLDTRIAATRQQIARLEGRFTDQPSLLRQYEDLERQKKLAETNLASYQKTRDDFQLEIAQSNIPWKVISPPAVNGTPVEPQLSRGLLQGLMFGLLAGTGAALVRDRLDHVFHSASEVRDELKVPLLGNIPYIGFFEGLRRDKRFLLDQLDAASGGIDAYQRFAYQESFRNLYTSLRFLNSGKPIRSLAVSSSVPAEGKSLVAVLLAKTLSELGQRVLLVDADLRRPQVHQRLGLNNLEGLSTLLTDSGRDWRQLLQPVADYPSWQVLTAGRQAPDPPRLLSSQRMGELVRAIAESGSYDLILYDTPPALGLADSALLAEQLDGILLVVGLSKVDRSLPAEAIDRIRSAGAPLLGVVTNSLKASPEASASYAKGDYSYGGDTTDVAALDPQTAYSYYQRGAVKEQPGPKGLGKLVPNRQNLRRWKTSLRRWLEGA